MMHRVKDTLHAALLASALIVAACGEGDEPGTSEGAAAAAPYAVASLVTDVDGASTGYLKLIPTPDLSGGRLDLSDAREFPGQSDVWVLGRSVYVASGDAPSITRYEQTPDGALEPRGTLSFQNFGIMSAAFWNNAFASPTRAYMTNGPSELIVWNPTTMQVEGTIEIPGLANRGALAPRASLADRSNIVHNGKLYRPLYWTTDDFTGRSDDSLIVVIDTTTDQVIAQVTVNCAGLDYATADESGRLFFSTWTGSAGTHLVLKTPPTCFAELDPATNTVIATTNFADVTGGHQAAAMKYIGGGKFALSVFDELRASAATADDAFKLVGTQNWQLWTFDAATRMAAPLPGVDWNSGAVYYAAVDGIAHALVPAADYANTTVYKLAGGVASRSYDVNGWSLRLFRME